MTLTKADTRHEAPFTFIIADCNMETEGGGRAFIMDVLIDDLFICGWSFIALPHEYEAGLQAAVIAAKVKAVARVADMRAEIARMQAIVDKVAAWKKQS